MKKISWLIVWTFIFSASCESDDKTLIQSHQIDSAVNARARQYNAELAARNDSILRAVELQKADEIARRQMSAVKSVNPAVSADSAKKDTQAKQKQ